MPRPRSYLARRGEGMTEYVIVTSLVAIFCIGIFTLFGHQLQNTMGYIINRLSGKVAPNSTGKALTDSEKAALFHSLASAGTQSGSAYLDSSDPDEASAYAQYSYADTDHDGIIRSSEFMANVTHSAGSSSGVDQADTSGMQSSKRQQMSSF